MSFGDGELGPLAISHRAPTEYVPGLCGEADAYVPHRDECAACSVQPWWTSMPALVSLHSIRMEADFVDIFHALQRAVDLRSQVIEDVLDCNVVDFIQKLPIPTSSSRKMTPTFWPPEVLTEPLTGSQSPCATHGCGSKVAEQRSRVRFCGCVQVHFWGADSGESRSIEVATPMLADLLFTPHFDIFERERVVQQLMPVVQTRLSDEHRIVERGLFQVPQGGGNDPFHDFTHLHLGSDSPAFLHRLQDCLQGRGMQFLDDEPLRIRTWYLHRQDRRSCHLPRTVELEGNPLRWVRDLQDAWMDFILEDQPCDFHVAAPDPPRHDPPGRVYHAYVLVAQGTGHGKASFISAFLNSEQSLYEFATVLPPFVNGIDLLATDPVVSWFEVDSCTSFTDGHQIQFNEERHHQVQDGDSFIIHCHQDYEAHPQSAPLANDDEVGFMAAVQRIPHQGERPIRRSVQMWLFKVMKTNFLKTLTWISTSLTIPCRRRKSN